jgi:hypothetical protein
MVKPRARQRLLAGLGTLAVTTSVWSVPAHAVPAPSDETVYLYSGTTLQSEWEISNDYAADVPRGEVVIESHEGAHGVGVDDATYDIDGADLGDAFDGGLIFFVSDAQLAAGDSWEVDLDGETPRAVTASGINVGGVTAALEHRAMPSQQVLRSIAWFTNTGSEPVNVPVRTSTNLGSDEETEVIDSSSGDGTFSLIDRWVVTADDPVETYDPPVTHVLAGPGSVSVAPDSVTQEVFSDAGVEGIGASYPLTLMPGETRGIMLFTELSADPATAAASASRFDSNPTTGSELLAGLSATDQSSIANWALTAPAPPPPPAPSAPSDSTAPISEADGPTSTADRSWQVTYTASDSGVGVRAVDLYVKAPGASTFTKAASDEGDGVDGKFAFTGTVDGEYEMYTVAVDRAGNIETAPASADVSTLLDTTAPTSKASSPDVRNTERFQVRYSADDAGAGVASVALFAKRPGSDSYRKVATDSGGAVDGRFTFTGDREGRYAFYTVATDRVGNTESARTRADTRTRVDTTAPAIDPRMGGAPMFDRDVDDRFALRKNVSEGGEARFVIRRHGKLVRNLGWSAIESGLVNAWWNGRDDEGSRVAPGRYTIVMKARDLAGNLTTERIRLRVRG